MLSHLTLSIFILASKCVVHAKYASQNRFYFENLGVYFLVATSLVITKKKVTCHILQIDTVRCNMYLNHMKDPVKPVMQSYFRFRSQIKELMAHTYEQTFRP